MDEVEPSAVRQALSRVPEIVHGALIQVVESALGSTAPDQCRNGVHEKAKLTLTLTERVFCLLPLVDVGQQHAPANELSAAIVERKASVLIPPVDTIRPPKALHDFVGSARRD